MTKLSVNLTADQIGTIIEWSINNDTNESILTTSAIIDIDATIELNTSILLNSSMNIEAK